MQRPLKPTPKMLALTGEAYGLLRGCAGVSRSAVSVTPYALLAHALHSGAQVSFSRRLARPFPAPPRESS